MIYDVDCVNGSTPAVSTTEWGSKRKLGALTFVSAELEYSNFASSNGAGRSWELGSLASQPGSDIRLQADSSSIRTFVKSLRDFAPCQRGSLQAQL